MLVFEREKLVFLALPKTGTSALEAVLEPMAAMVLRHAPNLKHTPGYRYSSYLKPFLNTCGLKNLQTTCVVRHPVGWLGSWYRYRSRPEKDGAFNSTKHMSFDRFVDEYASDTPAEWANLGFPPRFIRGKDGTPMIDHLFQYEQMPMFVAFLEQRFGKPIVLPRRNVSPRAQLELSSRTRLKLESKHPQMFEDWETAKR